ncbi:3862_t:CDS:1, partial [Gigaspora rosea]
MDGYQINMNYLYELRLKNETRNKLTMPVYNSFKGYLEDLVKSKLGKCSFDLAIIPAGLTCIYQLLD